MKDIMSTKQYQKFTDFPDWATSRIYKFRPDDAETWIFNPVPALGNQSILDVINQGEAGKVKVRLYLNNLMGKFFPEDS